MAQNSFALMTNLGRAKEAAALANGTAIVITHIAIGDSNTVPSGGETALYNEIARKAISGHGTVVGAANTAYFDIYLAASDGPYTIREAGLLDSAGDLIAIARYDPPISKPVPASGQTVEGTVRLQVAFSNIANVTIVVDPSFTIPLQRLSRLPWISVLSMSVAAPPVAPVVGDTYLIPTGATAAWAGHSGKIAEYTTAGWAIMIPPEGHGISLPDGRVFERIAGTYIEKIARDAQSGKWNYAIATGTANAIKVAMVPAVTAYTEGLVVRARVPLKNTTSVTLDAGAGPAEITTLTGGALQNGDLQALGVYTFTYVDGYWRMPIESQRVLTGDIDLYVRTDGNDANDGFANSASRAFRTIQYAIDQAQKRFISAGFKIRINVGNGTYSEFSATGASSSHIEVIGNTATPSSCIITGMVGKPVVSAVRGSSLTVRGFKLTGGQNLVQAQDRSSITVSNIEFGLCPQYQVVASTNSIIIFDGPCSVSGGAACFLVTTTGGFISAAFQTFRFMTTVNYSTCTVWANGAKIIMQSAVFVDAVNVGGTRYLADIAGSIYTAGGGANFIPGTIAGSVNSGGVYI